MSNIVYSEIDCFENGNDQSFFQVGFYDEQPVQSELSASDAA